ncbi:MAG: TonB-dependent receptor [Acidobacteria bacterium]|nr:TonB-dependent receptor [Acidobacteriota bacterium]MBV9479067.1 TonB-dependent receptor [Acidobacteriota bacterium]
MKRCPTIWSRAVWTALLVSLIAVGAYAQLQSGNIFGTVTGNDGAALPGVTVTLSGIGAAQNTVTDSAGRFRFINLSPGTYTLKAELAGYGTATRSGVTVNIGRNAELAMTLNPSVSQSITVTAEAPLLDVRKTGTGNDVPRVELEKIPSARDPWVILQQTPGVTMDRNNVGGNESGQQSVYVSKGTIGTQSTWNVDGVNITDFAATGSSPSYYDFDSFEEMQITTGGSDPRIMTPGVQLNMVTKRGTNDFSGSARYFRTDGAWQADPRVPAEATAYLPRVNEINGISDAGGDISGPIIRDKLWLWAAYGKQNINILSAAIIAGARFQDKTLLRNENVKLNAQPFASNSLTLVDQFGEKIKKGRNVGPTRLPETAWNQGNIYDNGTGSLTDPTLWKIEDTQLFGPNFYLTGMYSKVQGGFGLIADNGQGCTTFECGAAGPVAKFNEAIGAWQDSYVSIDSLRPQTQYRLDGSAFANTGAMSHEFKFGWGYREAKVTSDSVWPGGEYTDLYSLVGGTDQVLFTRFPLLTFSAKSTDAYIGDTMLLGNLTLQAALRYDLQKGANSAGVSPANSVVPEILPTVNFPAASGLSWDNISPRLGLTYALGADRRTLLRAGYNRYVNQLNSGAVTPTSPGAYSRVLYYFNDLNHDQVAQHNEIDFDYGPLFFDGFDPANPGAAGTAFTRWDPDLKAPITDEILLGGEREVLTNFSVGLNLTYRKLKDFVGTYNEKHQGQGDFYTAADYVQRHTSGTLNNNVPTSPFAGTPFDVTYYELAAGVPLPVYSVIRNIPDYEQTYKGAELNLIKRMSNRWMMRGNVTLQDWTQDSGANTSADPSRARAANAFTACLTCNGAVIYQSTGSGSKGNVYINSKWSTSLTGLYQIPVVETSLGFNLNSRQGYALPYVYAVRTREGTKNIIATDEVDSERLPNVTQLDMNLSKDFRFRGLGFTVSVDAFNVLNKNTVLQRNAGAENANAFNSASPTGSALNTSTTTGRVVEVLSPRVFRIGARFSF